MSHCRLRTNKHILCATQVKQKKSMIRNKVRTHKVHEEKERGLSPGWSVTCPSVLTQHVAVTRLNHTTSKFSNKKRLPLRIWCQRLVPSSPWEPQSPPPRRRRRGANNYPRIKVSTGSGERGGVQILSTSSSYCTSHRDVVTDSTDCPLPRTLLAPLKDPPLSRIG